MNYVITALIAISSLLGGLFVHDQITPAVGASQSISSLTELTSLSHNDVLPITEANGLTTKKVKWGTATSSMKTVFDPLYSPIFSTSAGLAGLLSDETGSSGGFVRAGSPTITSPVISSLSSLSVGSDATGDIYYRDGSGNFTRLAMPSGSGYYLTGSSTLGLPKWDNNILTNPYNAAMTFNATTSLATSTIHGTFSGLFGLSVGTTTATTSGSVIIENGLNMTSGSYFYGWASSTGYEIASTTDSLNFNTSDWVNSNAVCSDGKIIVGGGIILITAGDQANVRVEGSGPVSDNSWNGQMRSTGGTSAGTAKIYAICVNR